MMNRHRHAHVVILSALLIGSSPSHGQSAVQASNGIYIVGALHQLHETEPSFDFSVLRRVIEAIRPDIIALEVRPDELADWKDTPGRPEYPQVVWPLLKERPVKAVAMEPGDSLFAELSGAASAAMKRFTDTDPVNAALWVSYQASAAKALQAHWREPADTHDSVTADLSRSFYLTQMAMIGEEFRRAQDQWDAYMIQRAREVALANPKSRVLILASYRNRHRFEQAMRADMADRVVAMGQWLKTLSIAPPHAPESIVETRSYNLKAGTRDDFHDRFIRDSLPPLRRLKVDVVT